MDAAAAQGILRISRRAAMVTLRRPYEINDQRMLRYSRSAPVGNIGVPPLRSGRDAVQRPAKARRNLSDSLLAL
jgi:hypothetical protein